MKKKNILKERLFVIMTILLILVLLFCTKDTVMSQNKGIDEGQKQYYLDMEREYLSDIEALLYERGYKCSGITIRWISDVEGLRNYTIMIHHRKINSLSISEKEKLMNELSLKEFEDGRCKFNYEFINT